MKKKWYQSTLVIIASLVFIFPLGLFLMWKYASWNKIVKIVITVIVAIPIFGYIGKSPETTKTPPVINNVVQTTPSTTQVIQNYTFDIPSLVGKNVDEVITALQPYKLKTLEPTDQQIKLGIKDWDIEFEKDKQSLGVNYNIATRKINDFFIGSDDPSGATKDKRHLLELGNLKEDDVRYKVEYVKAFKDPTVFTGVKIITTK